MHQRRAADAYAHARAHARAHAQRVHGVHASQVRHAEHGYTYYGYMSMAIPSTAILTMATPTRRTMPTTSPSRRCGTTRTTALTTPPSSRRIRTCLGGCTTRHAAYPPLPTPPRPRLGRPPPTPSPPCPVGADSNESSLPPIHTVGTSPGLASPSQRARALRGLSNPPPLPLPGRLEGTLA